MEPSHLQHEIKHWNARIYGAQSNTEILAFFAQNQSPKPPLLSHKIKHWTLEIK